MKQVLGCNAGLGLGTSERTRARDQRRQDELRTSRGTAPACGRRMHAYAIAWGRVRARSLAY